MPSKTSKKPRTRLSPKPDAHLCSERICTEDALAGLARGLAADVRAGDRVILEGPMGAGKSTFARYLIAALGVGDRQAGSPTFAIAHEYTAGRLPLIHIDLYRLRSPMELEDAGIPAYFRERDDAVILVEWLSMFPELEHEVGRASPGGTSVYRVLLDFASSGDERRVAISRLS